MQCQITGGGLGGGGVPPKYIWLTERIFEKLHYDQHNLCLGYRMIKKS